MVVGIAIIDIDSVSIQKTLNSFVYICCLVRVMAFEVKRQRPQLL